MSRRPQSSPRDPGGSGNGSPNSQDRRRDLRRIGALLAIAHTFLTYCYNFLGIEHYIVAADEPLTAGAHQVRMEFAYDGGGLAKDGAVTLYYDGKPVGHGRVEKTQPMILGVDEACDIGFDSASPVSPDYGPTGNGFTGTIDSVRLETGDDSHEHLIDPEDRMTIAMTRQ